MYTASALILAILGSRGGDVCVTPQLVLEALGIVHRGNFNPAIFQPSWFAAQNLIRPQEAEAAEIEIIHPKVAAFTAGWLRLHVVEDRFHASTTQVAYFETLRDLVLGVFGILSHIPLKALGINRESLSVPFRRRCA